MTYRVQSLFAAHANLSTINQYLKTGETSWAVELNPPAPFPAIGMTPALHTLHLAKYVFDAFGISTDGIEPLWDKLIASVKSKTND